MLLAFTSAGSFAFGVLSAWLARAYLTRPIPVLGEWATLRHAENPGIAFGVRIPSPWQEILILGALALVAFIAVKSVTALSRVAYGLIIGGALANVFDRFADGMVTDYFSVGNFPIFNVPDSCITIGVALLLAESIGIFQIGKVKS